MVRAHCARISRTGEQEGQDMCMFRKGFSMILCDCSAVLAVERRNVLHGGACAGGSCSVSDSGACREMLADPLVDLV